MRHTPGSSLEHHPPPHCHSPAAAAAAAAMILIHNHTLAHNWALHKLNREEHLAAELAMARRTREQKN